MNAINGRGWTIAGVLLLIAIAVAVYTTVCPPTPALP